jgi:hypothetical protein
MSFSTKGFDKWMKDQGPYVDVGGTSLSDEQIKLLKNYPEVEFAGDLPFTIQQELIQIKSFDTLQEEIDLFLGEQYSLLSRNFSDFIIRNREPAE